MLIITDRFGNRGLLKREEYAKEHSSFSILVSLAERGFSWEIANTSVNEQIIKDDLRVRPSRLFLRGECYNANTLH